jgi:osmotically-inducible protein OsmY
LQRQLVDKDDFGHAAISVTVHDRVVTLAGTAPDQQTRQKAVDIAQSQAGVAQVIDHVQIAGPATGVSDGAHDQ